MKKLITLLLCMMLACTCVQAADMPYIEATIDSESAMVDISGNLGEIKKLVTVRILPQDTDPAAVTADDIGTYKYVYKTLRTDAEGGFSLKLILPDEYKGGTYKVYANIGDTEASDVITYINYTEVARLAELIDEHGVSAAFAGTELRASEPNYTVLALTSEEYEAFGAQICSALQSALPKDGYTASSLADEYSRIYFINKHNQKADEALVKTYAGFFDLNYDDEYEGIGEDAKAAFASKLKADYKPSLDSRTHFWDSLILARITTSSSYVALKDVFLAYEDYIGADMSDYDSLTNDYDRDDVFAEVYRNKSSYTTIKSLADGFENAADGTESGSGEGAKPGKNTAKSGYKDSFSLGTEPTVPTVPEKFIDMAGHWSREYVYTLCDSGIVNGFEDATFRPDTKVTRAEFIKLIATAFSLPADSGVYFDDVAADDWYFPYVAAAYNEGIAKGADGRFNPQDYITRQDAAALIYRALSLSTSIDNGELDYADSDDISEYAREAVGALSKCGIITGYDNRFNPQDNTSRAESATMLCRALDMMGGDK